MIRLAPIDPETVRKRKEDADRMREYADKLESGEITDVVIVMNNVGENCYERFGRWEDRWRMLGALEYAKTCIHEAD